MPSEMYFHSDGDVCEREKAIGRMRRSNSGRRRKVWWLAVNDLPNNDFPRGNVSLPLPPLPSQPALYFGLSHNGPLTVIGLVHNLCTSWYVMSYNLPVFLPASKLSQRFASDR